MHDFEIVQQKYHSKTLYIYIKVFSTRWRELREIYHLSGIITIIQIVVDYSI